MARVLRRASVFSPTPPEGPPDLGPFGEEPFTLSWTAVTAALAMNGSLNGHNNHKRAQWTAVRTVGSAVAVVLALVTLLGLGYDRLSASQLLPSTTIGGVAVGSRSLDEAANVLDQQVVVPMHKSPITLRAHETLRTTAWKVGVRVDVSAVLRDTYERQRSTSMATRLWRRVFGDETPYSLITEIERRRLESFLADAAKRIDREPKDANVEVEGTKLKVIPHQVGRRLDVGLAADRIVRGMSAGDRDIRLPVVITQPELRAEQFDKVVLVHTGANRLDFYLKGELHKSYPVATGTPGYPTPHGEFHITAKRTNPTWANPWAEWSMDMPAFIGPGPGNPLGTRAMNLSASGIRIHGTPDSGSIGGPASHGCIRMYIHDAEELFDAVDVGTPVIIVGS